MKTEIVTVFVGGIGFVCVEQLAGELTDNVGDGSINGLLDIFGVVCMS